ncbi:Hypothetical_protein [Hexamita inflata]|uniref:Hypothetical_protein n=1 Tax=Hexamita inflata TaxID=28002 RepID=A0AA86PYU4_9EUKA|nr:Hypothetical protein HINF_LOCUS36545 [Hexamita inflata]
MPTQQRPNRALTESLADQFHLIRQHNFQKLVLASQFLFACYFLRLAREVVPLYWHCLVVVAFDASFHQLARIKRRYIYIYSFHFLETAQTDFIETFESKTWALARQCFHFQNGLNPSFMPTQQRPSRALYIYIYICPF